MNIEQIQAKLETAGCETTTHTVKLRSQIRGGVSLPVCRPAPINSVVGPTPDMRTIIYEITGVPDNVSDQRAARLFESTADVTWLGGGRARYVFDFGELGEGRIIR